MPIFRPLFLAVLVLSMAGLPSLAGSASAQEDEHAPDETRFVMPAGETRAFLVGVESDGAVTAQTCAEEGYACPAHCTCSADLGICAYGGGSCRIDACEAVGCAIKM